MCSKLARASNNSSTMNNCTISVFFFVSHRTFFEACLLILCFECSRLVDLIEKSGENSKSELDKLSMWLDGAGMCVVHIVYRKYFKGKRRETVQRLIWNCIAGKQFNRKIVYGHVSLFCPLLIWPHQLLLLAYSSQFFLSNGAFVVAHRNIWVQSSHSVFIGMCSIWNGKGYSLTHTIHKIVPQIKLYGMIEQNWPQLC